MDTTFSLDWKQNSSYVFGGLNLDIQDSSFGSLTGYIIFYALIDNCKKVNGIKLENYSIEKSGKNILYKYQDIVKNDDVELLNKLLKELSLFTQKLPIRQNKIDTSVALHPTFCIVNLNKK